MAKARRRTDNTVTVRHADGSVEQLPPKVFRKPKATGRKWRSGPGRTTKGQADAIGRMSRMLGLKPVIPPSRRDATAEIRKLAALLEEKHGG